VSIEENKPKLLSPEDAEKIELETSGEEPKYPGVEN
jgi:hypothetical protein